MLLLLLLVVGVVASFEAYDWLQRRRRQGVAPAEPRSSTCTDPEGQTESRRRPKAPAELG